MKEIQKSFEIRIIAFKALILFVVVAEKYSPKPLSGQPALLMNLTESMKSFKLNIAKFHAQQN
ncbi:unnamed protein product [Ceratitis capitata]|uniref:(Mediterranean fruit fly) hypothetical protein n=1 Tax=Ceratitis capitata TaxID=7213 RepID=A0A811U3V5_CERCA|nr:unnamed protein product [Ceratitis capitata]